jgi:hypothetical protein
MARKTVHTIYGLYNPEDAIQEIRYVGFTEFTPEQRIIDHIAGAKKSADTHKKKWVRKLLRKDVRPAYKVLEITTAEDWKQRERYWIAFYRKLHGKRLTNSTDGGEGLINPTNDVRKKIGKKVSIALIGNQYRKGIPHTAESSKNISEGLKKSKKHKRAMKKWRGKARYIATAKTKKKLSILKTGVPRPDMAPIAKAQAEQNIGSFWTNNGEDNRLMRPGDAVPENFVRGRLMKRQMTTKNRHYITNGAENRMIPTHTQIPEGWRLGCVKSEDWRTPEKNKSMGVKIREQKLGFRLIVRGKKTRQLSKGVPLPKGWRFVKPS